MTPALTSRRFSASLAGFALALSTAAVIALTTGALRVPAGDVLAALGSALRPTVPVAVDPASAHVVLFVRAPRLAMAIITGCILGASGAGLQGVFRNPLADPGLLGISSGASLGAALHIVAGGHALGGVGLPLAAFAGGLGAAALAGAFSAGAGARATGALVLAGVGVNAAAGAGVGMLAHVATDTQLRDLSFWLLGSLGGATWPRLAVAAPVAVTSTLALLRFGRPLNALALGEADAGHLGLEVRTTRALLLAVAALGVSATVAVTGPLGFVGLVVPHTARMLFGADARRVLPAAALLGALLLVLADIAARTVAAPAEIPTGIVTAAVGAPFFLVLLRAQRRPA
ncbi:MAG: iron ABC transporter permease [Polyangiaceae bacterium]